MSNMAKTLIFIDDKLVLDKISKHDLEHSMLFSFNIHVHNFLSDQNLKHTIAETYLTKNDREEIFRTTISFWNWYAQKPFAQSLNHKEVNLLGILDTNELHQILVREIFSFLVIKRIIEKENPDKILCSKHFSEMIPSISTDKIKLDMFDDLDHNFLVVWDKILIRFTLGNIPISIPISRKSYTKIKNSIESLAGSIFGLWYKNKNQKKSILFVEFNPTQYTELLENLKDYSGDLIFLNRRRSAMWNYSAIKILKKFNCKIITPEKFLSKNDKKEASVLNDQYLDELEKLWSNSEIFQNIFNIEGKSFWNSIKQVLLRTYKNRLLEYIELVIFSQKFLNKSQINCILSLNILGETEKAILEVNKNQIDSILLEHGGTNYVPEISMYDISNMYPIFNDKIALWGNIQKNYLTNVRNISNEKILVTGSPRHDSFFNKQPTTSHSHEKIILLTPQVVQEYNAQADTNTYLRLEKLLRNLFLELSFFPNVKLIVKMHPTFDPGNEYVKNLIHKINPDVKIYHSEPIIDIIELCDVMININTEFFPSTVIYEGLIFKKPILNIHTMDTYYNFEFIRDNALLNISDQDNLHEHLEKLLFDKNFSKKLINNGQNHLEKYFANPGSASKELARILKSF